MRFSIEEPAQSCRSEPSGALAPPTNVRDEGAPDEAIFVHAQNMSEITQPPTPDCQQQIEFWLCCGDVIVFAGFHVETSGVKTIQDLSDSGSEVPGFAGMCERRAYSQSVEAQLHRSWKSVVGPQVEQRAEYGLGYRHAMADISLIIAVTLHAGFEIVERIDVLYSVVLQQYMITLLLDRFTFRMLDRLVGQGTFP